MSEYDKIWIEVDVLQERDIKTEKMDACVKALKKVPYVINVSKVTYQQDVENITIKIKEE